MSYHYDFAEDARNDFRDLSFELQEDVLDLLEEVVEAPWRFGLNEQDAVVVIDRVFEDENRIVWVRVRLLNDAERVVIHVLGVAESRL